MAYLNLAAATKLHRTSQIITDIGSNGSMLLYTGSPPTGPDIAATGTLLVTLPLSSVAAVASLAVQTTSVTTTGTGGTDGTYALVFTGGGGTGSVGYFTVVAGTISLVIITAPGSGYTSAPTISGFGNAGLTGAAVLPVMTAILTFNAISTATAVGTGMAGYARITKADGVTGIIDLDVGTTNAASVVMTSTAIITSGAVACSAELLIEA